MRKKKIVSLLLALVMTVTMLAGCGKGQTTAQTENGDVQENASETTGSDTAKTTTKDGKIQISMYMWDRSMFKELSPWLEQKFPDIEFTFIQSYNTMDYYTDLIERGEEMPDIIT